MAATTHSGNAILDMLLRGVAYVPPTRVWLSLHTDDPGNTGADEVSTAAWPAYQRQDPAQGDAIATGFAAATGKATANAKQMLFARHDGAAPVSCGWAAIWDAQTGGNCLLSGRLVDSNGDPTTRTFNPDDEVVIYPGEATFEVE